MKNHQTPLALHLRQKHTWFDLLLLALLWGLVFVIPENFWHYKGFSLAFFVKITALVASLEVISFISFHLLSGKTSLLLQGFLGGFVSSTTVYVQLNYDKRFENIEETLIAEALLMAICSMLIECLLIVLSISPSFHFLMLLPFGVMLFFIMLSFFILVLRKKKHNSLVDGLNDLEIDDPIVWKKVCFFSAYIAFLKLTMILLHEFTNIPVIAATFLASLFEAHAILAVNAANFSKETNLWDMHFIMLVILTGSLISKMFFVLKGNVLSQKRLILIPVIVSTFLTTLIIWALKGM